MDKRVEAAQQWLNDTYKGNANYHVIEVTGYTGNVVMEALVTALQIELGMTNVTGYFGEQTAAAYNKKKVKYGDEDTSNNIIRILQHGLFCKGYNPSNVTGYFGDATLKAVKKVQTDAGFSADSLDNTLSAKVFKEILSSDALVLIAGGDKTLRTIQQTLNRDYSYLFDIIPCDGKYGAKTAQALIYAFQTVGGLGADVANGNFGPATQNIATSHPQSTSSYEEKFVKIAKYALYCNGIRRNQSNVFDCSSGGKFTGIYDSNMQNVVKKFQIFCGMLEVTGKIELKEWMSLMVSTGYPKRNVLACDTSQQLTDAKAKRLVRNDFEIVGRYLTGSTVNGNKYLTQSELNMLFANGLSVFVIYQDEKEYYQTHPDETTTVNYYNREQGRNDAKKAVTAAESLGIYYGETIFFSVDYDFNDKQTTKDIIPHFQGIAEYIRFHGNKYKVGVYAPRNICTRIYNAGYASMCFVSDMSTGFSGNKGYALPEKWTFDQIREYQQGASDGAFNVDCVAISGDYRGFRSIVPSTTGETQPAVSSTEIANRFIDATYQTLALNATHVIAQEKQVIELPYCTVTTECKIGEKVSVGQDQGLVSFEIKDGMCVTPEYEVTNKLLNNFSYDLTYSDCSVEALDVLAKMSFSVYNGEIDVGIVVTELARIGVEYVIHKEASTTEGLSEFVEIGVTIVMKDSMTVSEQEQYNDYMHQLEVLQNQQPGYIWKYIFTLSASDMVANKSMQTVNTTGWIEMCGAIILLLMEIAKGLA